MAGGAIPALFVLFISNLLGSLVSIPAVLRKKKEKFTAKVGFGPFLIAGFLLVFFLQNWLIGLLAV
jgi:prepilin signal peptidase PulO-like enzyme (type II secretory pathway)